MRGITQEPGICCDCGKDLPVPRNNARIRCNDCSHKKDLTRTADWHAENAEPAAKPICKFLGGTGLPEKYREKYRPILACLGEFERSSPKQKYCKNCRPFARKWQQLQAATAAYQANPKKLARRALRNRLKRRKAAGLPVRRLGRMWPCQYRDKNGKRGEGCLGNFVIKSSSEKHCDNCKKLMPADVAARSRKKHAPEIKKRDAKRWKTKQEKLARLPVLEDQVERLQNIVRHKEPNDPGRPPGPEEETRGQMRLIAAFLKVGGWSLSKMSPFVFPHKPKSAYENTRAVRSKYRSQIDELRDHMTVKEAEALIQPHTPPAEKIA